MGMDSLPAECEGNISAHDWTHRYSKVGSTDVAQHHPNSVLGVEHILYTSRYGTGWNSGKESSDQSPNDSSNWRVNTPDDCTEPAVQHGADDIQLFAAEGFRIWWENNTA